MEKIDINERIFAVKIQEGWAICMRWSFNYGKSFKDEEDFPLIAYNQDFNLALISAIKKVEEYSFNLESKLMIFLEELTHQPDLKIEMEREHFEGCSQVCYNKNDKEFPYAFLCDEFEIVRG